MLFPSKNWLSLLAFVSLYFQDKTSLVDDVLILVSECLEPSWSCFVQFNNSVLSISMDTKWLLWELQGRECSLVIIEDPILGLLTILSFDNKFVSDNINCFSTVHSGIDRERHSNLDTKFFIELTLWVLSVYFSVINVLDVEFLVVGVPGLVLNKHILTISISWNFHSFSRLAIHKSLSLVLEDLPPLTTSSVDF